MGIKKQIPTTSIDACSIFFFLFVCSVIRKFFMDETMSSGRDTASFWSPSKVKQITCL